MDAKKRRLDPEVLMPELIELLNAGAQPTIIISGGSMLPFLAPGRDSVTLRAVDRELSRGDIVFYRRDGGRYILHRIIRVDGDRLWLAGDAQDELEEMSRERVFAYVTQAVRKGAVQRPGRPVWDFFANVWPRFIGRRRRLIGAYSKARGKFDRA